MATTAEGKYDRETTITISSRSRHGHTREYSLHQGIRTTLDAQDPPPSHLAALCSLIAHPDILCRILAFVPATHLPSVMRVSRDFHSLAGPLLYRDLFLPLSGLALPPHISPIGTLLDRAACSSPGDQYALLTQTSFLTRQRALLQSARTLRLGYHSHHVLPRIMRDLVLDMSRVDVLHLEGSAVCHHEQCPTIRSLSPKVVSIEAMSLDAVSRPVKEIDIRGVTSIRRVEHVLFRLRPTSLGTFPSSHCPPSTAAPSSISNQTHRSPKRLTIVLTPNTYIDGTGCTIQQPWRPSRFSPCGSSGASGSAMRGVTQTGGPHPTPKPSFCDFVEHIARACVQGMWDEVEIVGAEMVDETWIKGCVKEHRWKSEKEAGSRLQEDATGAGEGATAAGYLSVSEMVEQCIRRQAIVEREKVEEQRECQVRHGRLAFLSRRQWDQGRNGYLLDEPELGLGYKGKGRSTGVRPALPKSHSCTA